MFRRIALQLVALIALFTPLQAQITIPTNNYMPAPGTTLEFPLDVGFDSAYYASLSAGSGGPMLWDFSSRFYSGGFTNYSVDPQATPQIDSFPGANMVLFSVTGIDTSWIIYSSLPSSFTNIGSVYHGSGIEIIETYPGQSLQWLFPLNYNDQWTAYRNWTSPGGTTYSKTYDTTVYTADAWGTAQYMSNTFPCLRVRCEQELITEVYTDQDSLLSSFTLFADNIYFVADGFDQLAVASRITFFGPPTYSGGVSGEFIGLPTDIEESDQDIRPETFVLNQNYPNPFNPSTEFSLTLSERSQVTVEVYDILGKNISTLADRVMAAGAHVLKWDGQNRSGEQVGSGIYFYRMTAGEYTQTRKMVLLK